MTKIFKIPFATQGDRTSIPDDVQADGAVSYTQGYSYDYERDQITDPAAKDIEREKMNGMFHDITEAIGELQSLGLPKWAAEAKPYPIRAIVYHKNKAWQSKVENNSNEPAAGAAWHELKADLTASDINVYNKTESDKRFQPLGNYLPAGYSYSKAESDTLYQPKGNYAPAGNYALKGESYTKAEADGRYQPKGSYQPAGDYATNSALTNGLNTKLNISSVVQATGSSTTAVMSQKAVTDALQNAVNLNTIYPVGIVVWFAQNKNPNTLFPGTKWQYIGENKTIRLANSSGNNVLSSGGSDSIKLTEAQLPAHNHSFSATTSSFDYGTKTTNSTGAHTHTFTGVKRLTTMPNATNGGRIAWVQEEQTTGSSGAHTHTVAIGGHTHTISGTTGNKGSAAVITVTNAYIMLMGWYRIS
ncbi:phage tail protein [Providencia sp. CRE-3FA-0001]|uniref:Phage tail protein n=1 Tax=Providencia huashanensis TaxID=3037798 RepID=A0AA42JU43_9GAMM|nr:MULTISPECIES: phage tail protein [Providencia]EJD6411195.1 phage tail protein [Providencia rettgeri]EJD6661551.1 phage tail protein [Providencia rettgeri]ELR5078665.1 phage tail protein [Providencia rettgeri]ELR5172650.1 phage tail protein [Providencia rettgeri]ELR5195525.1 phage tail protein [Providencia rettgeri]